MNGACGDSLSECVTKPLDKNLEKENHCLQNYFNIFLIIISATVSDGAKKTLKGRSTNILRKEYELFFCDAGSKAQNFTNNI